MFHYYAYNKDQHDLDYLKQRYIKGLLDDSGRLFIIRTGYNFRSQGGLQRLMNLEERMFKLLSKGKELALFSLNRDDFAHFFQMTIECLRGKCSVEAFNFRALSFDFLKFNDSKNAEEYGLIPVVQVMKDGLPIGYHKQYCNISPKEDILYSNYGQILDQRFIFEKKPITVALLTLTHNSGDLHDCALFKMLLPSLAKTLGTDEVSGVRVVMYLGYDADDPIFDSEKAQEAKLLIAKLVGDKIIIKYHRMPRVRRLTLLWNMLAFSAYRDGSNYLFQLNDDSIILNSGWLRRFIATLQKNDDLGVVGPNDPLWECKLLTQAFVSRKHMEIFGWLFPPQIRDWYSDNWITFVYGKEHTFCSMTHRVQNGIKKDHSKRYMECDSPKWKEAITEGKMRIQKFLQGV